MDRLSKIILTIILALAFILRFLGIEKSPPSLNWDEAALGYNAYSILKTGKDEYGTRFPLTLRSFDDYKGAVYSYTAIPFIKYLGLNATAVRLPSAIAGTGIVLLAYLYAMMFFKSKKAALVAAFLVAVEPWSIHFSRAAFESNLALLIFLSGFYLILRFRRYYSGGILLAISALTYHAEKILIFPVAIIWGILDPRSLARFSSSSVFEHYQSPLAAGYAVLLRYFSYFSPVNLFVRGTPEPTQHIPNFGMYYPLEFVFLVIGLYLLIKTYKNYRVLFAFILITPIPAVLTWNWFYPARVLPFFFFLSLITAYGLSRLLSKITLLPILLLLIPGILNLATSLYFYLPYEERGNWQSGMKEMAEGITKYQSGYQKVVIETKTAQPYIFALFYSGYDPAKYQEFSKNITSPRSSFDFDKYTYRDIYWDKDKNLAGTLLIGSDSSLPLNKVKTDPQVNLVAEVNDSYGNLLYRIVGIR